MQQKSIAEFLDAAQKLGDAMLQHVQEENPELAAKVADAFAHGESLLVAFVVGQKPAIELLTRSDYKTVRTVASIPARVPSIRKH